MSDFGNPNVHSSADEELIIVGFRNALEVFRKKVNIKDSNYKTSEALAELIVERFEEIISLTESNLFSAKNFKKYWEVEYRGFLNSIFRLENNMDFPEDGFRNLLSFLDNIREFLLSIAHQDYLKSIKNTIDVIVNEIEKGSNEVKSNIEHYMRLRNIADNAKTESIYNNAVQKYRDLEKGYRTYFYWAIGLTVTISLGTFFAKKLLVPDFLGDIEFWVLKASIIVVGITLITYFLKQSSHYQRLADQNYQTQVELQAYPSFMESIPTSEAASVRKELALKYFGREIDGATHKDMSNLISDQMKSTTEMVKAATDVLKAKG